MNPCQLPNPYIPSQSNKSTTQAIMPSQNTSNTHMKSLVKKTASICKCKHHEKISILQVEKSLLPVFYPNESSKTHWKYWFRFSDKLLDLYKKCHQEKKLTTSKLIKSKYT